MSDLTLPLFCKGLPGYFGENTEEILNARLVGVDGSRGSSKTQSLMRLGGAILLAEDGEKQATFGRITEKALDDSMMALVDNLFGRDGEDVLVGNAKRTIPEREFYNGSKVLFRGFNPVKKAELKGTEKGSKLLWIDEIEKWSEQAGMDTINTYLRAGGRIWLSANRMPEWAEKLIRSVPNSCRFRIDYWENPYLDEITRQTWNNLKEEDERLWKALVLYDGTGSDMSLFTERDMANLLQGEYERTMLPERVIMGIDVAAVGGDNNVITILKSFELGHRVEVECLDMFKGEETLLYKRAGELIAAYNPDKIVVDANGQGIPVYHWFRNTYGNDKVVGFIGSGAGTEECINARAAAHYAIQKQLRRGVIYWTGGAYYDMLQLEMRNCLRDLGNTSKDKIKLVDKSQIRKALLRSPDLLDSVSMCFWEYEYGKNDLNSNGKRGMLFRKVSKGLGKYLI